MGEQEVVHLPELALRGSGLGGLGGELSAGVNVVERQVAPHVAHVVAVAGEQLPDGPLRLAAVGALEVAVLDQGHRGVVGPADVVVLGVDVHGQVEDVIRGPTDLPSANGLGQSLDELRYHPGHCRRDHDRGQRPEPRLVERSAMEREGRDEQRHREADARARAGGHEHRPAERGARPVQRGA